MRRLPSDAGIAIGPILFVLALLGILAMVSTAGVGNMSSTSSSDRVSADINSQANLIRMKINECYMQFLSNGVDNTGAPPFDSVTSQNACSHDSYPCSTVNGTTNTVLVSDLRCPGDSLAPDGSQQNIWSGSRPATLPPPSPGFSAWMYFNGSSTAVANTSGGERCIWTAPSTGRASGGIVAGLTTAASKFSSQETNYVASSNTQKFVIFITPPINGTLSDSSPCAP